MGARFSFHGLVDHQFSSSADPEPETGDDKLEREMDESQESSEHYRGHRTIAVCVSLLDPIYLIHTGNSSHELIWYMHTMHSDNQCSLFQCYSQMYHEYSNCCLDVARF